MWRVFAISALIACGNGTSGDDVPDADAPIDSSPVSSDPLFGVTPVRFGSAYVRVSSGQQVATVARSDGDWIEGNTYQGGTRYGMKFVGAPFTARPVCVVTEGAGESSIVRTGACHLREPATTDGVAIRCWDRVMPAPGSGLDTDFTIACVGPRNGLDLEVEPTTAAGLRIGAAIITRPDAVEDVGDFVIGVTSQIDGDAQNQTATVDRLAFRAGVFDDAPNCLATSTGAGSVELARSTVTSTDIEPNTALGSVSAFHALCLGEHAAPQRIDTTSTRGAVLVAAAVTNDGVATALNDWTSEITKPAVGTIRFAAKAGVLPHAPVCACSTISAGSSRCTIESATTDAITIRTLDENSNGVQFEAQLICVSER